MFNENGSELLLTTIFIAQKKFLKPFVEGAFDKDQTTSSLTNYYKVFLLLL